MDSIYTPIGNMVIIEVYQYFDRPILYSCESISGQKFIVVWIDSTDEGDKWFFVPVSNKRFISIRSGRMSLRDAITNCEDGWLWELWMFDNSKDSISMIYNENIQEEDLPDNDSFIQIEPGMLPKKEVQTDLAAIRSTREVLDISLETNGGHSQEIEADVLGSVLVRTQSLANYLALKDNQSIKEKIPQIVKKETKLKVTEVFAASFGIRLESENTPDLLGENEITNSLEKMLTLIKSTGDDDKFKLAVKSLNPRARNGYKFLLQKLKQEGIEAKFEWASPSHKKITTKLTKDKVTSALNIMNLDKEDRRVTYELRGELVGINTDYSSFSFKSVDGDRYSGKLSTELREQKFEVPVNVDIQLEEITEINPVTEEEQYQYILLSIVTHE